jgi:hypothetical protein
MAARKLFTMTPSSRTTISKQSSLPIDDPSEAVLHDDEHEDLRESDSRPSIREGHDAVLLADRDGDWFFARRP